MISNIKQMKIQRSSPLVKYQTLVCIQTAHILGQMRKLVSFSSTPHFLNVIQSTAHSVTSLLPNAEYRECRGIS